MLAITFGEGVGNAMETVYIIRMQKGLYLQFQMSLVIPQAESQDVLILAATLVLMPMREGKRCTVAMVR